MGKTIVFAQLAKEWEHGRILVVAHLKELIMQAADKIAAVTGDRPGIEMGELSTDECHEYTKPQIVVASRQTLARRMTKFDPNEFGLVIIDECHHSPSNSYLSILDHFRQNTDLKVLGVTATPLRGDGLAMGNVFESVSYDYGIEPAVDDGYLVPVNQKMVVVDGLDFSNVRTLAGDFNESELEKILVEEKHLHDVAAPTVEMAGNRSGLVFCVSVRHAEAMAHVLRRYKQGSALHLHGGSDPLQRKEVIADFRSGKLQFLCNCGLFLEGFDAPITSLIVMARPTKSVLLYTQVLGRGTRTLPGVIEGLETAEERKAAIAASDKPAMTVLDFVGNSGRHKIITAADILGGEYSQSVRDYAKDRMEDDEEEVPLDEALEDARIDLDLLEEEEERQKEEEALRRRMEKRRELVATADYYTQSVSAFGRGGGVPVQTCSLAPRGEPPTDKQVWVLINRCNISPERARSYTKRQASAVIAKCLGGR